MARLPEPVLDASALICLVRREKGWEKVANHGVSCSILAVNLTEVIYGLTKHGMPVEAIAGSVEQLLGEVVPFDRDLAFITAAVHARTRKIGASFADCACLALALSRHAVLLTADKDWSKVDLGIKVIQIR